MSNNISSSQHQISVIGASDYSSLIDLAYAALTKDFDVAAELVDKLEKSIVVPDGQSPHDAARIGSTVTFDAEGASRRAITLVYPDEIDVEAARISVLTPIGVALLGLRQGQCSQWFSRDGQRNELIVVRVVDRQFADLPL
ncbi:GreA/GreB family elongation factor [Neorhizobium alkalisoli]|uniref:GreA/GreB family elongation factor n=1 Tax=Neorhizobium alkalisoli TaxID=528178 RepID=UPI000CF8D268|nr:GreA/GreB family elongation factor [Neorhizobium alkalisoli]